jgi:hypothetical protein
VKEEGKSGISNQDEEDVAFLSKYLQRGCLPSSVLQIFRLGESVRSITVEQGIFIFILLFIFILFICSIFYLLFLFFFAKKVDCSATSATIIRNSACALYLLLGRKSVKEYRRDGITYISEQVKIKINK